MKFQTIFLIVISLFHGYLLWAYSGISHYWLNTAPPTGVEASVRVLCLFGIIASVFIVNFVFAKVNTKNDWPGIFFNTIFSFAIVHFLTLLLSQVLDLSFVPESPLTYNTFEYYWNNPTVLPFEIILLNLFACGVTIIVLMVFRVISRVSDRSAKQNF